jgi:hypothetical protein
MASSAAFLVHEPYSVLVPLVRKLLPAKEGWRRRSYKGTHDEVAVTYFTRGQEEVEIDGPLFKGEKFSQVRLHIYQ